MKAEELLSKHEGKTLEFKRDLSSSNPILKTLAAFSNTSGGVILIGVADKTRSVIGVSDPLAVDEKIMNVATDGSDSVSSASKPFSTSMDRPLDK